MVTLQLPLPSTVVLPTVPFTELVSTNVLLASAVPVMVGVLSLVILSVFDEPVSDAVARSGVDGASGGVESTSTVIWLLSAVVSAPEEARRLKVSLLAPAAV